MSTAHATEPQQKVSSLMELSLEELDNVQVTSVSRKAESRFKAAAAVSVITADDIERSGATSIPEALRLVPGLNVAQIDSNKWAISARGFNRQFSNKLLVLVDGRTVYTPLFSGVYWDVEDLHLPDIDRIEVIKGPGATLWGSNAVNGIINIITKDAEFTQGTNMEALAGNYEKGTISARHGGKISDNIFYRAYAKYLNRDETKRLSGNGIGNRDNWSQERAGFRMDWNDFGKNDYRIQGDVYHGRENQDAFLPGLVTPGVSDRIAADESVHGGNILASWTHSSSRDSEHNLQMYIDYIERDVDHVINQDRITFDVDYQHKFALNDRNELVWGLGYRFFKDHIDDEVLPNGQEYLAYEPNSSSNNLYSAFVQNDTALVPDTLDLTLGSKFEHNYYTGWEIQPSARMAWYPSDNKTLWASVSRSVRIPTRTEYGLSSIAQSTPFGFVRLSAPLDEQNFQSETSMAYETGFRYQPLWWASFDLSAFYNTYDDLRTFDAGNSGFNIPNTILEGVAGNNGSGEVYGFELISNIDIAPNWRISAGYAYLEQEFHLNNGSQDVTLEPEESRSPQNQITLTSRYNITDTIELDNNLFFVDNLADLNISSYTRFDTRLAWKLMPGVQISAIGQNLFDSYHQEYTPFLFTPAAEIGRSAYLKLKLDF